VRFYYDEEELSVLNCRNQDGQDLRMNRMSGMNRTKGAHALALYPLNPTILTILIPTVILSACLSGERPVF